MTDLDLASARKQIATMREYAITVDTITALDGWSAALDELDRLRSSALLSRSGAAEAVHDTDKLRNENEQLRAILSAIRDALPLAISDTVAFIVATRAEIDEAIGSDNTETKGTR